MQDITERRAARSVLAWLMPMICSITIRPRLCLGSWPVRILLVASIGACRFSTGAMCIRLSPGRVRRAVRGHIGLTRFLRGGSHSAAKAEIGYEPLIAAVK